LDDWVDENNPVQVIDVFVDTLDLVELGFEKVEPVETGRPAYHPSRLLKLCIYGYLNRVQSSRRLEREVGRNVELMWPRPQDGRRFPEGQWRRHPPSVRALCRALRGDGPACDGECCD
jgi:hypothetical protein